MGTVGTESWFFNKIALQALDGAECDRRVRGKTDPRLAGLGCVTL